MDKAGYPQAALVDYLRKWRWMPLYQTVMVLNDMFNDVQWCSIMDDDGLCWLGMFEIV